MISQKANFLSSPAEVPQACGTKEGFARRISRKSEGELGSMALAGRPAYRQGKSNCSRTGNKLFNIRSFMPP